MLYRNIWSALRKRTITPVTENLFLFAIVFHQDEHSQKKKNDASRGRKVLFWAPNLCTQRAAPEDLIATPAFLQIYRSLLWDLI